jgi:hypothetical protein
VQAARGTPPRLVIYSPARGSLEAWPLRAGPCVASLRTGRGGLLAWCSAEEEWDEGQGEGEGRGAAEEAGRARCVLALPEEGGAEGGALRLFELELRERA